MEILSERVADTKFPWLMSNVIDNETGRPLGDGKITHVIEWAGKRIGLVSFPFINSKIMLFAFICISMN